ncbi:hypothetical protein [Dyadobacter crusticola]|uniref:hypothetical protein n=1 Tax=Dyadobacter crusticola TaxID=292407 RepID=UPI0004E0EC6F|nr:hypothetical protein [Dyadobacter crusticola]
MKWFIYLFSLYLLTLSGFTCEADSDCCKEKISEQASNDRPANDHKAHSVCIPFLACGACNSILPSQLFVKLSLSAITIPKAPFYYLEATWTNMPASIWQPPQIA